MATFSYFCLIQSSAKLAYRANWLARHGMEIAEQNNQLREINTDSPAVYKRGE